MATSLKPGTLTLGNRVIKETIPVVRQINQSESGNVSGITGEIGDIVLVAVADVFSSTSKGYPKNIGFASGNWLGYGCTNMYWRGTYPIEYHGPSLGLSHHVSASTPAAGQSQAGHTNGGGNLYQDFLAA